MIGKYAQICGEVRTELGCLLGLCRKTRFFDKGLNVKDVTIAAPASGKTFTSLTFTPVETTEADLLAKITALNAK